MKNLLFFTIISLIQLVVGYVALTLIIESFHEFPLFGSSLICLILLPCAIFYVGAFSMISYLYNPLNRNKTNED